MTLGEPRYLIARSILSADLARLGQEVDHVLAAGVDIVLCDVMDNHYVPNLTFGPPICRCPRDRGIGVPIDVHLVVEPVDKMIRVFADAGASIIFFHAEASRHVHRSLQLIRDLGCGAGLAFNPATPLAHLKYVAELVDMVLIMSVNPGYGGQEFIPTALCKLRAARRLMDGMDRLIRLEVDGGIRIANIRSIAEAGADTFVAGSAIFGSGDYPRVLADMRASLSNESASA